MNGSNIEKERDKLIEDLSKMISKIQKVLAKGRKLRGEGLIVGSILSDLHEVVTALEDIIERINDWEK